MWHRSLVAAFVIAGTLFHVGAFAQDPFVAARRNKIPQPLERYKGRIIAQTMHFSGAEWLVRDEREREERCSLMLASLGLKPGMHVCDMGCGNGFYTLQMAKMVGEAGHIYAVDVQPEMLVNSTPVPMTLAFGMFRPFWERMWTLAYHRKKSI